MTDINVKYVIGYWSDIAQEVIWYDWKYYTKKGLKSAISNRSSYVGSLGDNLRIKLVRIEKVHEYNSIDEV